MNTTELYTQWLEKATADPDLQAELQAIAGQDEEIRDRFYRSLEFGTAGLRGVIGAGTNRMNVYTVGRATQGLADYLNAKYDHPSVAIGYDSRIKSDLFSKEATAVLAGNGIKVYLYEELEPTPCLSFAVRQLGAQSGIILTASHNPAKYNGYKCYNKNGYQMTDDEAAETYHYIEKVDYFTGIKKANFDAAVADGTVEYIGEKMMTAFLDAVETQCMNRGVCQKADLKVIYTPLNGTGNKPVRAILDRIGVPHVYVVPEQELPDGDFPTVSYPNPEAAEAFALGLKLAEEKNADLVLATDPDADRLGVYVKDTKSGKYISLTGNMSGSLLCEYVLSQKAAKNAIPADGEVVKSIVSTNLIDAVAASYNCKLVECLTGFKWIGQQILKEERTGVGHYMFGMEESYGCLIGTYARDKDAVSATVALCEAAAYYKTKNMTLWDAMVAMYEKYGYYKDAVKSIGLSGIEGLAKIQSIMEHFRNNTPEGFGEYKVLSARDYKNDIIRDMATGEVTPTGLPSSNVLYYDMNDNAWLCIRPSGTEPKIKFYYGIKGSSYDEAQKMSAEAGDKIMDLIYDILEK